VLAGISKQPWLTCIQQHKKYDSLRLYKTRNTKENILYAIFLTTFRTCLLCSQAALTGAVGVPRRLILGAWGWHPCLPPGNGAAWEALNQTGRYSTSAMWWAEGIPWIWFAGCLHPQKWPIRINQTKQYVMQDMQEKTEKKN
jgi:hypothetical protein